MKKIKILILISLMILPFMIFTPYTYGAAQAEYLSYQEIILSSGKLVKNFTDEEISIMRDYDTSCPFMGVVIIIENQAIKGKYIASVKECMENRGDTDIKLNIDYQVETNSKTSFTSSGSISASAGGNIGKIKAEASAKAGVEYNNTTSTSIKEKRTLEIVVEPNSQYMVIIEGSLSVSNGYAKLFFFWNELCNGCFEFVTLESQYARLEKRQI